MCFGESNFFCADCGQYLCRECNERVHRHPKRKHHSPSTLSSGEDTLVSYEETTDEYDMDLSPSLESSFIDAELVATLAKRLQLTSFRKFQKTNIEATLEGRDTLVLHPTGSGKSLCFHFPPSSPQKESTHSDTNNQLNARSGSEAQQLWNTIGLLGVSSI